MGLPAGAIGRVSVVDEHSGTAARARLAVESRADAEVPETLFVKLPPANFQQQLLSNLMDLGEREVAFYRLVGPDVPIRVPRCYGTAVDQRRGRNVILLEDLDNATFRDVRDACSAEEVAAVVDALADLHSAFWESDRFRGDLADYKGRSEPITFLGDTFMRRFMGHTLEGDKTRTAEIVSAEVRRKSRILLDRRRVEDLWEREPQTVVHGDTHLGNLFFEGAKPGFLDWQVSRTGPGIRDVSYFIVSSTEPSLARQIEEPMVDRYVARLATKGIEVDRDHQWKLYRAVVSEFYISAVAALEMNEQTQPEDIARAGVARVGAAAEALDTFDILEELLGGSGRGPQSN